MSCVDGSENRTENDRFFVLFQVHSVLVRWEKGYVHIGVCIGVCEYTPALL